MQLIPVPFRGSKCSPEPSKWIFDIKGGHTNVRESFLSLDLFSLTFKNIFLALRVGEAIGPIDPPTGAACALLRCACKNAFCFTSAAHQRAVRELNGS